MFTRSDDLLLLPQLQIIFYFRCVTRQPPSMCTTELWPASRAAHSSGAPFRYVCRWYYCPCLRHDRESGINGLFRITAIRCEVFCFKLLLPLVDRLKVTWFCFWIGESSFILNAVAVWLVYIVQYLKWLRLSYANMVSICLKMETSLGLLGL